MRKEIESRLIKLSAAINLLAKELNKSTFAQTIESQMIRASASAALNYGEAQGAESKKDFVHKTSVVLKELRETGICLRLLSESNAFKNNSQLVSILDECDQLSAIFQKTVNTARMNSQ